MEKSAIRKIMLQKLNALSSEEYEMMSEQICRRFLASEEFIRAASVALTISRAREVDTHRIIEACWRAGKRVSVPKCTPSTKTMEFREITSFEQLETVYLDLKEPVRAQTDETAAGSIDLAIVPGVVFSPDGYRIGYGGGYYDRFLEGFGGSALSLAFELQIEPSVPLETHDIPVGKILTEERVILCSKAT